MKPEKTKKPFTGRDWLLVRLLEGATKSGVHIDRKKQASRRACRRRVRMEPSWD